MRIGDLVVRWWHGKPLWSMIGIVTDIKYVRDDTEERFIIYWNQKQMRKNALWSTQEIKRIDEIR